VNGLWSSYDGVWDKVAFFFFSHVRISYLDKLPSLRVGCSSAFNNPLLHYGTRFETLPDSGTDSVLQNHNTKHQVSVNYLLFCGLRNSFDFAWDRWAVCIIQDVQCTYIVTLRGVRVNIVSVLKQWVLHILSVCICSLRDQTCNAHTQSYHLWPALPHKIFPHYLMNGKMFENKKKKVIEHKMCVSSFSTIFV
jgi:hypothetical protein